MGNLKSKKREELDEIAKGLDINPDDFSSKPKLIAEIEKKQDASGDSTQDAPEATQESPEPEQQPTTEEKPAGEDGDSQKEEASSEDGQDTSSAQETDDGSGKGDGDGAEGKSDEASDGDQDLPEEKEEGKSDEEANKEQDTSEGVKDLDVKEATDANDKSLEDDSEDKEDTPDLITVVTDQRRHLDEILDKVKLSNNIDSDSADAIFLGRCWLGKILSLTDKPSPYNSDADIAKGAEIKPTADTAVRDRGFQERRQAFRLLSRTEAVATIRGEIAKVLEVLQNLPITDEVKDLRLYNVYVTQAFVKLNEARFYLGDQLARIRG